MNRLKLHVGKQPCTDCCDYGHTSLRMGGIGVPSCFRQVHYLGKERPFVGETTRKCYWFSGNKPEVENKMKPSEFREGLAKAIHDVFPYFATDAVIAYLETAGVEIRTVVGKGYLAERIIIPLSDWLKEEE